MEEKIMKGKELSMLFVVLFVSISVTGWGYASHCVDLLKDGTFKLEPVPSKGYYLSNVQAHQVDNGLEITGKVKRRSHAGLGGGHVDITIVSPEGKLLEKHSTFYSPRIIPMRRMHMRESGFEVRLPKIPPDGSTIRIAHHRPSKSVNKEFICGNNRAASDVEI